MRHEKVHFVFDYQSPLSYTVVPTISDEMLFLEMADVARERPYELSGGG